MRTIYLPSNARGPLLPPWLVPEADAEEMQPTRRKASRACSPGRSPAWRSIHCRPWTCWSPSPWSRRGRRTWGSDLRYWGLAAKLALELLAQHKYLPALEEEEGQLSRPVAARARRPRRPGAPAHPGRGHAARVPRAAAARTLQREPPEPSDAPAPHELLDAYLRATVDAAVRDWGRPRLDGRRKPPSGVAGAWWSALWADGAPSQLVRPQTAAGSRSISQRRDLIRLYEAWQGWIAQLRGAAEAAFRLCFRLEPPEVDPDTGQVIAPDWTLRYMLQAPTIPACWCPPNRSGGPGAAR